MTLSPLINGTVKAHETNYTKGREDIVRKVTIHHMGGINSAWGCGQIFARPNRCGSSHYGIGNDGLCYGYVSETDTAWADSNWSSNSCSITIEVSNCATSNDYPVSSYAYNTLIKLIADIFKRYNLGKAVKGVNVTWHSMYAPTICCGDYLRAHMDDIVYQVNVLNGFEKVHKLDGMDIHRKKDALVFYTKGDKAKTNKYGIECRIVNYKCVAIERYKGGMSLNGGWVLSGHGDSANWLSKYVKIGTKVVRKGDKVIIGG